ncbi:hypothetical protein A3I48_03000 [Candidatus Daviesbacteria bacterium RIFCSPLOWO2_02_FULL_36_7]|uniref:Fimbrial assembly protein n=1 Tax=Candidatus Daviesbacteria bacterium RIFCSPLOWO2_02_FULL_36_7 TaxID=1797792 RepID=A0A1F5MG62_9BACT|nr:MAG: hypothetical protein A3I48_03000 [Candidatus Daviesbacteria bacterium RIFCSPLOWO2_02_FULL_36_7]
MAKISINLLPPEILAEQIKGSRFYKIQLIGITVILMMVFLLSLTVVLRILQNRSIVMAQVEMDAVLQQVSGLKSTEASLYILKNRLAVISKYLGVSSKQSSMYKLIDELIPSSAALNAVNVDKEGGVVLLLSVFDSDSLDTLITNLSQKESNEDKIDQVSIDSLNRGRDGIYRISLKIKSK